MIQPCPGRPRQLPLRTRAPINPNLRFSRPQPRRGPGEQNGGYLRIAADQRWLQTVIRFRAWRRAKRRLCAWGPTGPSGSCGAHISRSGAHPARCSRLGERDWQGGSAAAGKIAAAVLQTAPSCPSM